MKCPSNTTRFIGLLLAVVSASCTTFAPAPTARPGPPPNMSRAPYPTPVPQTRNYRPSFSSPKTANKPTNKNAKKPQAFPQHAQKMPKAKPKAAESQQSKRQPAPIDVPSRLGPEIIPHEVIVPAKLELEVKAPRRKQVGSGATYRLIVRNTGDEKADDVVIECEFDDALSFPGQREKKARQSLGRVIAGETKEIALTLVSDQIGEHACRFTVTSSDVESVWKSVTVEFLPKRLDVEIVGPSRRTLESRGELTIKLTNTSDKDMGGVKVAATHDATLKPKEATTGALQEGSCLTWDLGTLGAGEGVQLQIEFDCPVLSRHACMLVSVTGDDIPDEEAEKCLEIVPIEGTLDLQVDDVTDLLSVNEETEYRVSIVNRGLQTARDIRLTAEVPTNLRVLAVQVYRGEEQLNAKFEIRGQRIVFDPIPSLAPDIRLEFVVQAKALGAADGEFRAELLHAARQKPVEVREMTTVNP